jgi:hypothetical protein
MDDIRGSGRRCLPSAAVLRVAAVKISVVTPAEGLGRADGDVLGWLGFGDAHLAWTLRAVEEIFAAFPAVAWISSLRPAFVDGSSVSTGVGALPGFSRAAFLDGATGDLQAPATFFRRSLWERAGGRFPEDGPAADVALWARFHELADLVGVDIPLAVSLDPRPDPRRLADTRRIRAALGARLHHRRSLALDAAVRLGLARVARLGPAVEARVGYTGRRLIRPLSGPDAGRFVLEEHAFS